jgi:hypothetical protein
MSGALILFSLLIVKSNKTQKKPSLLAVGTHLSQMNCESKNKENLKVMVGKRKSQQI